MNRIAASTVIALLALGVSACGQEEGEMPVVPAQPAQDVQSTPGAPARLPTPDPATGGAPELPQPGQVNDHSSPAFRGEAASMPEKK